jgi:intracellular multiplication protein IcmE
MPQDPEPAVAELPTPRAVSKWRGLGFTMGAMGAVIGAVVLTVAVSSTGPAPVSTIAPPGASVRPTAAVTGNASAKYNQEVAQENTQRVTQAAGTGESFVATPVGNVEPTNPIQPADADRSSADYARRPPAASVDLPTAAAQHPERTNGRSEDELRYHEELRGAIDQYLSRLDQGWRLGAPVRQVGHADQQMSTGRPELAGQVSGEVGSSSAPGVPLGVEIATPTTVRVGDTLYASNEYEVNSDIGTPAVARVLAGELQGAKLKGKFKLASDYLVLEYDQLILPNGTVLSVQGMAVAPGADRRLFLRSDVDHHWLERWGGFLGSVYLATYGQKLEQSGETTVVTTGAGGTTTVTQQPQYGARQINEIALGRMGSEVSNELRRGLSKPPTVSLKAHAELGVLILAAPSRAQQLREAQQQGG